jgi:2-methylisocitrate lyase-like PEP mutase family enzyme
MLEAYADRSKILAFPCSYDGLSSRLIEEAGFPMLFLSGFAVSSTHGIPDTGYIAMAEMCDKIQETVRVASLPIMVDGDTGYGSAMNVKRTVESFAAAGAAGVMIEDQTWPKRTSPITFPLMISTSPKADLVKRLRPHQRQIRRFSRRSIRSDPGSLRRPQRGS